MRRGLLRLLGAALLAALCACASGAPAGRAKPAAPRRSVLLTDVDEVRAGREGARQVLAEMGVLDDPALTAYVREIGSKLLRGVPRRPFAFEFHVVDQVEPNAFALPGGWVFVSRGLLLLANSEDELACVMGHEISHVVLHHAAAQQAIARSGSALAAPWRRVAQQAAYSREMERRADADGQRLCAAAGYDPRALVSFLRALALEEQLRQRVSSTPGFFQTHPGSTERAAAASVRASEIRWRPDPARPDGRTALLRRIDGLAVGQRPESGIFVGERFLHPDLGFQIRFPAGWRTANGNRMVGAMEPLGAAIVYLASAETPPGDAEKAAQAWLERTRRDQPVGVHESKPVQVGAIRGWRLLVESMSDAGPLAAYVTFLPYRDTTYLVAGVSPARLSNVQLPRTLATARSFGPLPDAARRAIRVQRLRVVTARAGEDGVAIARRTGSAWTGPEISAYNGVQTDHRFAAGESVKIAVETGYAPAR